MTDKLTPGMLRDLARLSAKYEDPNSNYDSWGHMLMVEAARREAEAPCDDPGACEVGGCLKPSLCQAAAVEDKPAPQADPSDEALIGTLHEIRVCFASWQKDVRVLGNVRSEDACRALDWALTHLASNAEALAKAQARIAELEAEAAEAAAVFATRYPRPEPLPTSVRRLMKDHADIIETVCRLRGECKFDEDLARFMRIIDHEPSVSRGQMSDMLDFAQGQKARAEAADAALAECRATVANWIERERKALSKQGVTHGHQHAALAVLEEELSALATKEAPRHDD
jgi:hypothetical protein